MPVPHHLLQVRLYPGDQVRQLRFADRNPVDQVAFGVAVEMGRGEQPHPATSGLQDRGRHHGGRPLAVGAADVYHPQLPVRVSQELQQVLDPLQSEIETEFSQADQEVQRFVIGHG